MYFVRRCFLFLFVLIISCYSLTCRTEGGPTESELKKIYTKCLKMQEGKNSTNGRSYNEQRSNGRNQRYDIDRTMYGYEERNRNKNDEVNTDNNKRSNSDDRSNTDKRNNRNGSMSNRDDKNQNDRFSSRNDFQNDQYGSEIAHYNGYYSSTQPPRRYKREKHVQNSGKRSQYNPNIQRSYEDISESDEKDVNINNSSVKVDNKACAMHCFLQNLEMTGDNGLPDRYLVANALTKDAKNEDLYDFLQESIEECFQILDNENTEEKCEYSKNLLICLSEKGKANCDDWNDNLTL